MYINDGLSFNNKNFQNLDMDMRLVINNHRIGEIGDIITISNKNFKLVNIDKILISCAAAYYYRIFGFESPKEFIEHWVSQRKPFVANSHVYIHYFEIEE